MKFLVETIQGEKFRKLGYVEISLKEVEEKIERTKDIKESGPWSLAKRKAREKWPEAPVIIVTRVYMSNNSKRRDLK